jgi:hypothetical protein
MRVTNSSCPLHCGERRERQHAEVWQFVKVEHRQVRRPGDAGPWLRLGEVGPLASGDAQPQHHGHRSRLSSPPYHNFTISHISKLLKMSEKSLCDPCKGLLRGENPVMPTKDGLLRFAHHTTAESFQQALALSCGICRRLRAMISRRLRTINCVGSYANN